jgi:cytochrome c-type biogenesis protein CcmE
MTRRQRRLLLIGAGGAVLGVAVALVLFALKDSIVFFNSPTDVVEKHVAAGTRIRLGGLVKPGVFEADTILAKHDENYMPREVADALKKQGHWMSEKK